MKTIQGGGIFFPGFLILLIIAGFFICPIFNLTASESELMINEILVGSEGESKREFIELYNPTDIEIDLENYSLKKKTKSGNESNLVSSTKFSGTVVAKSFFVIAHPDFSADFEADLSYSGSSYSIADNNTAVLYNANDEIIDLVGWGEASIHKEEAAPNPVVNESIERKILGKNTNNNLTDFEINSSPSPGEDKNENDSKTEPTEEETSDNISSDDNIIYSDKKAEYDYSANIYISEIFPNPVGTDEEEFIELYNAGERSVNLFAYRLGDSSTKPYELAATIQGKGYLLIKRKDSKIALNNNGDTVALYFPFEEKPKQKIQYTNSVEGQSYNCIYFEDEKIKTTCRWSKTISPGQENQVEKINHPPQVDFDCPEIGKIGTPIRFISSDTIDEDGDVLEFYWDFGDGFVNKLPHPEHTYLHGGEYTVKLSVSDTQFVESLEKTIFIAGNNEEENLEYKIVISEFMPNPSGADQDGEWIEIHNQGNTRVNLRDWQIDDNEAGSRPFDLKEDYWLDPGAYFLFDREETGLALNNSSDSVRLLDQSSRVIDSIDYKNVSENTSMARAGTGEWQWTLESTPGENNIIKIIDNSKSVSAKKSTKIIKKIFAVPLEKTRNLEQGDLVRTRGTVAVLPGVFGVQYFYIVGSPGIQIYNYKKNFPALKRGDYIEVNGEISLSYGEKRIKTKSTGDIKFLEKLSEPKTRACACADINKGITGELVSLSGEIVERKGSSLYLDDGTDERLIYIKRGTGISASEYNEGDKLEITGIVVQTKSGVRVQPRNKNDIVRQNLETSGKVLGKISSADEWSLPEKNNKQKLYQYLLIVSGTIIIIFGIIIFRLVKK
ncbi:MAG: lamin tail domain-containing protein [Patescibacteria group bacterium]|nr:lamin tail domain-containing protein [Patescibacteria group bacterium]